MVKAPSRQKRYRRRILRSMLDFVLGILIHKGTEKDQGSEERGYLHSDEAKILETRSWAAPSHSNSEDVGPPCLRFVPSRRVLQGRPFKMSRMLGPTAEAIASLSHTLVPPRSHTQTATPFCFASSWMRVSEASSSSSVMTCPVLGSTCPNESTPVGQLCTHAEQRTHWGSSMCLPCWA